MHHFIPPHGRGFAKFLLPGLLPEKTQIFDAKGCAVARRFPDLPDPAQSTSYWLLDSLRPADLVKALSQVQDSVELLLVHETVARFSIFDVEPLALV